MISQPPLLLLLLVSVAAVLFVKGASGLSCELTNCASIVHPLLKEPKYIIPSNAEEVDYICNTLFPQTWSKFVDCIKDYSTNCMNSDERVDINRAVGDSINSVHKICTNVDYRQEYFQYAGCIRDRISSTQYCNDDYNKLIASVEQEANKTDLCCNHHVFKECLIAKSDSCCPECAEAVPSNYARMFLDKALGFVLNECTSHSFSSCTQNSNLAPERTPQRQEHYDGPDYFPSGGREHSSNGVAAGGSAAATTQSGRDTSRIQESYQPLTEWIDEEKVEEFKELLDNSFQEKRGSRYNSGSAPFSTSLTALTSLLLLLLLYNNR
jgi:hypothetical protein